MRSYRRVFGPDAAEASRLRWDWQYRHNPQQPGRPVPLIWVAREGPCHHRPVRDDAGRAQRQGRRTSSGSWGMDVMVAPERQRQGLGELLFGTWDRHVGAALGLGLSPSSHRLFQKLRWPEVGPVPYLVKPLTRRAFRRAEWPMPLNRLVSAVTLPYVKFVARHAAALRRGAADPPLRRVVRRAVGAPRAALRSSRCAATPRYLQWKYVSPPHVRYTIAALDPRRARRRATSSIATRASRAAGSRCSSTSSSIPTIATGSSTLLRWVDREARAADSDKIRGFCHARRLPQDRSRPRATPRRSRRCSSWSR